MNHMPPLKALLAFSVVAETQNVSKAAKKLFVTQSAVSQQLKVLEDYLGTKLLQRKGKYIELTSAGKQYSAKIDTAFDAIRQATITLRSETVNARVITVNMLTTFATRWLIPRLIDFQAEYPDYELRISTPIIQQSFLADEIDAVIYLGDADWPGLAVEFLFTDKIFPVCSPLLLKGKNKNKLKLSEFSLLQVSADVRKTDWTNWLKAAHFTVFKSLSNYSIPNA